MVMAIKVASSLVFMCLLVFSLFGVLFSSDVCFVKADFAVYIWPDGLVEPSTAPIMRDGDVYRFTANLNTNLIVQKSNIVIDGDNYVLAAGRSVKAIYLYEISNVTIKNLSISDSRYAIYLDKSSSNTIVDNEVSYCGDGIVLDPQCDNNVISNNTITHLNFNAVFLGESSGNMVSHNQIVNCSRFLDGHDAVNNAIFENSYADSLGVSLLKGSSGNRIFKNTGHGNIYVSGNNNSIFENKVDYILLTYPYDGLRDLIPSLNCAVYSNHVGSITLSLASYSSVFNNTITGYYDRGIYLEYASSFNNIYNNTILSSNIIIQGGGSSSGGSLDCINNTISNNRIRSNNQNGIDIVDSKGSNIFSNFIAAEGAAGIYIDSGRGFAFDVKIVQNIIADSLYGVYIRNRGPYGSLLTENLLIDNKYGILMDGSNNNLISGNNISSNSYGICTKQYLFRYDPVEFASASNNTITGNFISKNTNYGIYFNASSQNNAVHANNIAQNNVGVGIGDGSSKNLFYGNNFVDNLVHVESFPWRETWNLSYPAGGNFWSNYTGGDSMSGPNQNSLGSDGIGDIPHIIDSNNQDQYPLISLATTPRLNAPSKLPEPFPEPSPTPTATAPPEPTSTTTATPTSTTSSSTSATMTPSPSIPEYPTLAVIALITLITTAVAITKTRTNQPK